MLLIDFKNGLYFAPAIYPAWIGSNEFKILGVSVISTVGLILAGKGALCSIEFESNIKMGSRPIMFIGLESTGYNLNAGKLSVKLPW